MADTVKITADIPQETVDQLKWLSSQRGVSMADVLSRAIERETYFAQETANNSKVLVEKPNGKFRQVVIK